METKIEGIVLNKYPYRDRDVIVHLLLRNGGKIAVNFFGGRGGGKKQKSSLIELGHLLKVELSAKIKNDVYNAKEWSLGWHPEKIRYDYQAYQLHCFYLETLAKIAPEVSPEDDFLGPGHFRVLSNGLFYLEESLQSKNFEQWQHLSFFLAKLVYELGIGPNFDQCYFCNLPFDGTRSFVFNIHQGGMVCGDCSINSNEQIDESAIENGGRIRAALKTAFVSKYGEYTKFVLNERMVAERLFQFLCSQFHLEINSFKTYKGLFQ